MPGSQAVTERRLKQSPAMRDSPLTLPVLARLRDPTITFHQVLRPHTHRAAAQGVYCMSSLPCAKWSDRTRINTLGLEHCDDMQGAQMGGTWSGESRYVPSLGKSQPLFSSFSPVGFELRLKDKRGFSGPLITISTENKLKITKLLQHLLYLGLILFVTWPKAPPFSIEALEVLGCTSWYGVKNRGEVSGER